MPMYEWKCQDCGQPWTMTCTIARWEELTAEIAAGRTLGCDDCGGRLVRRYTPPPIRLPNEGHYNPTVGGYVSGDRDLREQLKVASERATARTGVPHDFKPVDLRDHEAIGVTAEGMDTVARRMHDEGRPLKLPKALGL